MTNPFETMPLEAAQKHPLWDSISVEKVVAGTEHVFTVAVDKLLADIRVNSDIIAEGASPAKIAEIIRERLECDFQELAMVIQHKLSAV